MLRTLALLDDGNTVPFIARYRKEMTGNLDEVQILGDRRPRRGSARRYILASTMSCASWASRVSSTTELAGAIIEAATLQTVEDLYLPYRPKRKTRASVARERGLQPLADLILAQDRDATSALASAEAFVNVELGVESASAALAGARDICAEVIMEAR